MQRRRWIDGSSSHCLNHPARLRVGSPRHVGSGGFRHDAQADVDSFGPLGPNSIEVHLRWGKTFRRRSPGPVYRPEAKSLVLIVDDLDAPDPVAPKMTWLHWVLYNIPSDSASALPEGAGRLPRGDAGRRGNDWTADPATAAPVHPSAGTVTFSSSTRSTPYCLISANRRRRSSRHR